MIELKSATKYVNQKISILMKSSRVLCETIADDISVR